MHYITHTYTHYPMGCVPRLFNSEGGRCFSFPIVKSNNSPPDTRQPCLLPEKRYSVIYPSNTLTINQKLLGRIQSSTIITGTRPSTVNKITHTYTHYPMGCVPRLFNSEGGRCFSFPIVKSNFTPPDTRQPCLLPEKRYSVLCAYVHNNTMSVEY